MPRNRGLSGNVNSFSAREGQDLLPELVVAEPPRPSGLCPSRERPTATFSSAPPRFFSNPPTCLRGPLETGSITTRASPRVVSCKGSLISPSSLSVPVPGRVVPHMIRRQRRSIHMPCVSRLSWPACSGGSDASFGPSEPAGYSRSGTRPSSQASSTGSASRQASSASSARTKRVLLPSSRSRRAFVGGEEILGSEVGAQLYLLEVERVVGTVDVQTQGYLVRLQPETEHVGPGVVRPLEREVGYRLEVDGDLAPEAAQGLASAQHERHARPAQVVDHERDLGEGLGARSGSTPPRRRRPGCACSRSFRDRSGRARYAVAPPRGEAPDGPQEVHLAVAQVATVQGGRASIAVRHRSWRRWFWIRSLKAPAWSK